MKHYIIIGAGNAGLSCANTIRKYDKSSYITIISHENFPPYCRCLLTYFIESKINKNSLFEKNMIFLKEKKINYIMGDKVEFIESSKNKIILRSKKELYYDKLFIATGAEAKTADIEHDNSILITGLRTLIDAIKIMDTLKKGDTAIIWGGGLVSLKTLLALFEKGIKIYWIISSNYILSYLLDQESATIIENYIIKKRIKLIKNSNIIGVKNKIVKIDNGMEIKANALIIGKGVKAVKLNCDKEIKFMDGYFVNEYFETNIENIYAGGDCANVYDIAHNRRWKVPLWPIAGEAGIFAGKNMVGINSKSKGVVPVNSFSVFDNNIIAGGKKIVNNAEKNNFFEFSEKKENSFKKFITDKNGNLKGYIFINDIFNSGIYYHFIKGGQNERNFN